MVLWEITLATAYFLGLKRTYRLALKLQRRLISPKRVKIRQFLHRRTRGIFDVALTVHHNIQQRDLEVGRNLGNWILRWLDRMKPSAQIRTTNPPRKPTTGVCNTGNHLASSSDRQNPGRSSFSVFNPKSDGRRVFASSWGGNSRSLPTLMTMIRPVTPVGTNIQYRQLSFCGPYMLKSNCAAGGFKGGVLRGDIMQWMQRN